MLYTHFFVRFVLAIFCLFFLSYIHANEERSPRGYTLEDFFVSALDFSPDLKIAQENLNIRSARKKAADGLLLPQVNAGANVSDNRLYQLNQLRTFEGERYYLGLTQTLFDWQQFATRKRARLEEDQLEEEYFYQLAVLLGEVSGRYFGVLQIQDAIESNNSEIEALSNQLDQVESLYDRQLSQITDHTSFQLDLIG